MIDPLGRWRRLGDKPDYAGLLTLRQPSVHRGSGASSTAWTSRSSARRPTTSSPTGPGARYAPRAIRAASCPPGPHLEAGVDALRSLRAVDFGDAPVIPADPQATHAAIEETVGQVADAGAVAVVLGGDHSITEPSLRADRAPPRPARARSTSTRTPTPAREVFGVERSHGTPMYRLVEQGHVDPARYVQIGLRGYWPEPDVFAWQAERGITSFFMRDVRELGIREVLERALERVGAGPAYLTVDVDVLDPAFAPGTGTPEPGGHDLRRPPLGVLARRRRASSSSARTWSRCSRPRSARPT